MSSNSRSDPTFIIVSQPKAFKVILSTKGNKTNSYLSEEDDPNKICLAIEKAPLCRIYTKGKCFWLFNFNFIVPVNDDKVGQSM